MKSNSTERCCTYLYADSFLTDVEYSVLLPNCKAFYVYNWEMRWWDRDMESHHLIVWSLIISHHLISPLSLITQPSSLISFHANIHGEIIADPFSRLWTAFLFISPFKNFRTLRTVLWTMGVNSLLYILVMIW